MTTQRMRVVFLGSPQEVLRPLKHLHQAHDQGVIELVGVVSQPARPAGRKRQLTDPPVAAYAKSAGIPTLQPEKARDAQFLEEFKAWKPDVAVTAAYGQILSDAFLAIPTRATINIHPSLLPKYRGATPVPAALLAGDESTGVTILFTVKALDAGPIIVQKPYPIGPNETAGELTERMFMESCELLSYSLEKLTDPNFHGVHQLDAEATFCTKIEKSFGAIDWQEDAHNIFNKIRAYSPWPGAYCQSEAGRIVLIRAHTTLNSPDTFLMPGEAYFDRMNKQLVVGTSAGHLVIEELKVEGRSTTDGKTYWNGVAKGRSKLQWSNG